MIAPLALVAALASEPAPPPAPHVSEDGRKSGRVHVQLDGDAIFGIGAQMFLGMQLHVAALVEHWTTRHAIGTWDFGGTFAYQNEAVFLAPFIDPDKVRGAGHRTQLVATAGHTVHMGNRRRVALGLHLFGGWNAWRSDYTVTYADEDVHGHGVVVRHRAVVGTEIRFAYRFHRNVGFNVIADALMPTTSSYLITFGYFGVGLAFYLR